MPRVRVIVEEWLVLLPYTESSELWDEFVEEPTLITDELFGRHERALAEFIACQDEIHLARGLKGPLPSNLLDRP